MQTDTKRISMDSQLQTLSVRSTWTYIGGLTHELGRVDFCSGGNDL
jgi:hypothetical protein